MSIMEIIGPALGGGTLVALISWWRFRKKDTAEAFKIEKEGSKQDADAVNTIAQILKLGVEKETGLSGATLQALAHVTAEWKQTQTELKEVQKNLYEAQQQILELRLQNGQLKQDMELLKQQVGHGRS